MGDSSSIASLEQNHITAGIFVPRVGVSSLMGRVSDLPWSRKAISRRNFALNTQAIFFVRIADSLLYCQVPHITNPACCALSSAHRAHSGDTSP
jgi:hypothetical protein